MITIYKYPIQITDKQVIAFPAGYSKVLHIGLDPTGQPCVWAKVNNDPKYGTRDVPVLIYGTGMVIDPSDRLEHYGTFVMGDFVWHVFMPEWVLRS